MNATLDFGAAVFVEIKQIDDDTDFRGEVKSRTVGSHVRAKINEARKQAKTAASEGAGFLGKNILGSCCHWIVGQVKLITITATK